MFEFQKRKFDFGGWAERLSNEMHVRRFLLFDYQVLVDCDGRRVVDEEVACVKAVFVSPESYPNDVLG